MTDLHRDPCPSCGKPPRPHEVQRGWRPCMCGGHQWRHCDADHGGCGTKMYDPPLAEQCKQVGQGFD